MAPRPRCRWLAQAGLSQYAQAFSGVDERGFRALLMQDYGKFGVTKMEDKQKLFRLIKSINSDKRASKPPAVERASPARDAYELTPEALLAEDNTDLLDLNGMDDLLSEVIPGLAGQSGWARGSMARGRVWIHRAGRNAGDLGHAATRARVHRVACAPGPWDLPGG
mmetsp:Transcript_4243/g.13533  ORF Transcript_4243/g.13533 Transcript_4243/m.13533 type:complete len:166 (-) Transcript_4243:1983-2480(-)